MNFLIWYHRLSALNPQWPRFIDFLSFLLLLLFLGAVDVAVTVEVFETFNIRSFVIPFT